MIHKETLVSKKKDIRNVLNGYMSIFRRTAYWGRGAAENAPALLCERPPQPASSHMTSILTYTMWAYWPKWYAKWSWPLEGAPEHVGTDGKWEEWGPELSARSHSGKDWSSLSGSMAGLLKPPYLGPITFTRTNQVESDPGSVGERPSLAEGLQSRQWWVWEVETTRPLKPC